MQEKSNLCREVMQLGKKSYNICCGYVSNYTIHNKQNLVKENLASEPIFRRVAPTFLFALKQLYTLSAHNNAANKNKTLAK